MLFQPLSLQCSVTARSEYTLWTGALWHDCKADGETESGRRAAACCPGGEGLLLTPEGFGGRGCQSIGLILGGGGRGAIPKYIRGRNNVAEAPKHCFLTYWGRGRPEAGAMNMWMWWFVQDIQG